MENHKKPKAPYGAFGCQTNYEYTPYPLLLSLSQRVSFFSVETIQILDLDEFESCFV